MAAVDASAPFAEVINSLDESKIPDKLHCPACHKFLLDGWKVVCCDQTVCGSCYSTITDHCPVCEHRPMSQDLCKPNKALRNTAKAYLKTAEKKLADERAKAEAANAPVPAVVAPTPIFDTPTPTPVDPRVEGNAGAEQVGPTEAVKSEELTPSLTQHPLADQPQPSIETSTIEASTAAVSIDDVTQLPNGSEEVADDEVDATQQDLRAQAEDEKRPVEGESRESTDYDQTKANGAVDGAFNMGVNMNAGGFPTMMNMNMNTSFSNPMDYNQMMQYVSPNGMGNFNNMMGMPNMGINPMTQGMFGGFGGPNMGMAGMNGLNSMNGMNMGMNFNPGQGMYGAGWNGQNSNMWNGPQSNNPNAFSNGMGGDFGTNSGYGYNPSQQGNFHQHQYPNGDFQGGYPGRGYGRGRGRARGAYGRGRGGYGQVPQGNYTNYQHPYEQQQQEIQNMQAQMTDNDVGQSELNGQIESDVPSAPDEQEQLNFAPGGQDEVQEALGDDYSKAETIIETEKPTVEDTAPEAGEKAEAELAIRDGLTAEDELPIADQTETIQPIPVLSPTTYEDDTPATEEIPSVAVEPEGTELSMPPPSAPLGPAAQFADPARDYGFRGRGYGRLSSRGRGSFHAVNGHTISPVKPASVPPFKAPVEPKGTGVIGAPTGPKAMRTPAVNGPVHPVRGRGGGFQIVGRASMTSRGSMSMASEKSRSATPTNNARDENDHDSRSSSHQRARHHHRSSRRETDTEEDREGRHDRKSRRSRNDNYEDRDMQDGGQERPRSATPEESRRSSHRREKDRDRHSSSTKHRSSRSHRHRDEVQDEADYDMDSHNAEPKSAREAVDYDSRSSRRDRDRDRDHHTSRSSRYDEKEREDSQRDRRKRSRREREDGGVVDEVEEESRHRSRRHKREHGHGHHEESVNGRKGSERSSAAATPVEPEKDMHTLEREARNQERMLKEQQRRENAMNAERGGASKRHGVAGGRRVSYKYEDETQSAMVEQEREAARWR